MLSRNPYQPVVTPYAIYERAQAYWLTQRYPEGLAYSVAVSVVEGGKRKVERYASFYDAVTNVVQVDPVSDYETQQSREAHGRQHRAIVLANE